MGTKPMVLLLFSAAATAQVTVEGDVVRKSTGEPLSGVRVSAPCGQASWTATDVAGHFRCTSTPDFKGKTMAVWFDGPGLLPRKQLVTLDPQGTLLHIRMTMTPQAVIAGKVVDEAGWPIRSIVTVAQYVTDNGNRRLEPVRRVATDDLGAYRIGKLPPGRYYIRVRPSSVAPWSDYLPAWYPSAALIADARAIDLREGQEASGMDISLARGGGVSVRGRVTLPDGYEPARGYLTMSWEELGSTTIPGTPVPLGPDGAFTVRHVAPGRYTLLATTSNFWDESTPQSYSARRTIEVSGDDMDGIVLHVVQTVVRDLKGTVVCEGGARPDQVRITLARSLSNVRLAARVAPDGSFVIPGVWPGRYRGSAFSPGGYASSVQLGGQEILNREFEFDGADAALRVTIRPEGTLVPVSGTVMDANGRPVAGASVILLPAGTTYVPSPFGSLQPADTDQNGAFTAWRMPPGVYRVYVVRDPAEVDEAMNDPAFLKSEEQAFAPLTVVAGQNPALRLVLPQD
jgi:protocatechuate 3,4-dioxygenase beta subunit